MGRIALVRAPFTYRYNGLDVREEVILAQLSFFLGAQDIEHEVFDFHLARHTRATEIVGYDPSAVVIAVRETGDNVYYALRLARFLSQATSATVVLYGQTARLAGHPLVPAGVKVVPHSEAELSKALGLGAGGPMFGGELRLTPYFDRLPLEAWQTGRVRGTVESTRGCPYPCKFCFINAGRNHDTRWQRQSTAATIDNLRSYTERGTRAFVFHDSEFFGGSRSDIAACDELIETMLRETPDVYFKIYARADTIAKYGKLDRLREAGLVSVFIGVESFVQSDLDGLRKALSAEQLHATIGALADSDIYMDLSFILFHRHTTPASLRQNLEAVLALYSSDRARYLGMPHFTFSFESAWSDAEVQSLSRRTYVDWDVRMKTPATGGAVFDPAFEPLMEIYRLLAYEWSKKVILLNIAREEATDVERGQIETWFRGLGAFCARTMLEFLAEFDAAKLTFATLEPARAKLFARIESYYGCLPERWRTPVTFTGHARDLNYSAAVALVEEDEYWSEQIPDHVPRTVGALATV